MAFLTYRITHVRLKVLAKAVASRQQPSDGSSQRYLRLILSSASLLTSSLTERILRRSAASNGSITSGLNPRCPASPGKKIPQPRRGRIRQGDASPMGARSASALIGCVV